MIKGIFIRLLASLFVLYSLEALSNGYYQLITPELALQQISNPDGYLIIKSGMQQLENICVFLWFILVFFLTYWIFSPFFGHIRKGMKLEETK